MTLFYSEYAKQWKATLDSLRTLPDPKVRTVKRGILLPLQKRDDCPADLNAYMGGVCGPDFTFVAGLERNSRAPLYNLACKKSYVTVGMDVRQEKVVFGGIIFGHFGHMILDGMTRLWYHTRIQNGNIKFVFVLQPGASSTHAERFLKLAGVNYEILRGPTQFQEVIVPDEAFYTGEGGNKTWLSWFNWLKAKARDDVKHSSERWTPEKIYLTRREFSADDGVGEIVYESFFKSLGYTVIAPEKLPLSSQIRHISNATHIATTMGTMAHMLAFARPEADVTILLRSPSSMMPAQLIINKLRGFTWRMIDGTRNPLPTGQSNGCFLYEPTVGFNEWCRENKLPAVKLSDDERRLRIIQYLHKWAKRFSDPANYKYIKNRTMKDAVDSLTKYFQG